MNAIQMFSHNRTMFRKNFYICMYRLDTYEFDGPNDSYPDIRVTVTLPWCALHTGQLFFHEDKPVFKMIKVTELCLSIGIAHY